MDVGGSFGAAALAGEPVGGVAEPVKAQVAALASGDHVGGNHADRVTVAEVGNGKVDCTVCPQGGLVIDFAAAVEYGSALVMAALPGTLASVVGANVADRRGELVPAGGVV